MLRNVGKNDRLLRIIIGVGLLSLTVIGPKSMWGLIGLIPLVTGLVGTCALYSMLGLSTASSSK